MSVSLKAQIRPTAGFMMARKPKDWPAHHFDFKRWLLWGERDNKNYNGDYPKGYPSPSDCLPDPENEFEVEGVDDYGY